MFSMFYQLWIYIIYIKNKSITFTLYYNTITLHTIVNVLVFFKKVVYVQLILIFVDFIYNYLLTILCLLNFNNYSEIIQ